MVKMISENQNSSWRIVKLKDILFELESGKRPKGGVQGIESGIPSIGAEHLNIKGGFKFEKIKFVPIEFAKQMNKGIIKENDIIVVKDGATTGKTSFVGIDFPYRFAVINEHVFIVRVKNELLPKYVFYKLFSSLGKKEILEDFRGAAQGGISSSFVNNVNIPIPPLREQQLIVSKIEQLFSELENGKQQLETALQQLKIYRQSLLKWAFEGKLTNKNVKEGELPVGWKWVKLGEVTINLDGKRIPLSREIRSKRKGKYRYYGATEIVDNIDDYIFDGVYLLIGEDGANLVSKSRPLAFIVEGKFWVNNHAHVLQAKEILALKYLSYYFNSLNIAQFVTGSAQPKLTQANLNKILIPLPLMEEQQLIIQELESKLTICDKIEEAITNTLQQAETLSQSILKMAFDGKLRINQDEEVRIFVD